jgi:hypothetical protein
MSTAGIRRFQDMLTDRDAIRAAVYAEVEAMLYYARDRTEWVDLDMAAFAQTRAFLLEVARRLAAQDPQVRADPVAVKARQIAPELIRTEWCTDLLVQEVCQYVAEHLETGALFGVYTEVGMDNRKLELDMGLARGMTAVQIAQGSCAGFAYRVFTAVAGDDLEEG